MTETHTTYFADELSIEERDAALAEAAELALADYHAHLDQLAEIAYEDRFSEGYEPDFYEDGPRAYAH